MCKILHAFSCVISANNVWKEIVQSFCNFTWLTHYLIVLLKNNTAIVLFLTWINIRSNCVPEFSLICVILLSKCFEVVLYSFSSHADNFVSLDTVFFPLKKIPGSVTSFLLFISVPHCLLNFVCYECSSRWRAFLNCYLGRRRVQNLIVELMPTPIYIVRIIKHVWDRERQCW